MHSISSARVDFALGIRDSFRFQDVYLPETALPSKAKLPLLENVYLLVNGALDNMQWLVQYYQRVLHYIEQYRAKVPFLTSYFEIRIILHDEEACNFAEEIAFKNEQQVIDFINLLLHPPLMRDIVLELDPYLTITMQPHDQGVLLVWENVAIEEIVDQHYLPQPATRLHLLTALDQVDDLICKLNTELGGQYFPWPPRTAFAR